MRFEVYDIVDLKHVATTLLNSFSEKRIFAFKGEMGVGKTTFIGVLLKAMGVTDDVSSPTYGYVNEYESPFYAKIYHFDLYRITNETEAYDIGIEEYLYTADGVLFIEWAENIKNLLPDDCVWVNMTSNDLGTRIITIDDDDRSGNN